MKECEGSEDLRKLDHDRKKVNLLLAIKCSRVYSCIAPSEKCFF